MGTWLGFHDPDTPLLAKLVVHDHEHNTYIFVNRSGTKMRQLSQAELFALIKSSLVAVLEARSSPAQCRQFRYRKLGGTAGGDGELKQQRPVRR